MGLVKRLTQLSHEFGTEKYVKGGGGNTSAKNADTLWIKPSGTTLATLEEDSFVPMDRAILNNLSQTQLSCETNERENQVKEILLSAVKVETDKRPSVETMLHNAFSAQFVVHTHPALVNGLTCAVNGKSAAQKLFPQSVWVEYTDPGYVLFALVDAKIKEYQKANGVEPKMVFLENHGVFVAADSEEEIHEIYGLIMDKLATEYNSAGISQEVNVAEISENASNNAASIKKNSGGYVAVSGGFKVAQGPLTPDHIVYAKSFPYCGDIDRYEQNAFRTQHGYDPVIYCVSGDVFACGDSQNRAELAMELAKDGALIIQLCAAFGGVKFMSDEARLFIENWEAESYRSAMIK